MLKEFAQYIVGLGEATPRLVTSEQTETTFFDKPVYRPDPPRPVPQAAPRQVATLRSFARYLEHNVDRLALADHLVHVVAPGKVELVSRLEDLHRRRETVLVAAYESGVDAYLDRWVDLESMVIGLMALFGPDGDRAAVLDILKSLTKEKAEIREDNGLSQRVTVQAGVAMRSAITTPNPVTLFPFSVFPEAALVPRLFVLRIKDQDGISVLLRPADGNAWETLAVENVAMAIQALRSDEPAPKIIF